MSTCVTTKNSRSTSTPGHVLYHPRAIFLESFIIHGARLDWVYDKEARRHVFEII